MEREFDVVLFGATGFTGKLCAEYLHDAAGDLRWAIAGRNSDKLRAVNDVLGLGLQCITADVNDEASLRAMAARAKVVASTVGPYTKYGEPLVRACIDSGTHYADITGEPEFVDGIIVRLHEKAKEAGVRIVNCCGFDSIPYDLGALYTVKQLQSSGALHVDGYVRSRGDFSGGTWQSAVHAFGRVREMDSLKAERRRLLEADAVRKSRGRASMHYNRELKSWGVPLPTIDPEVVARSGATLDGYGSSFSYGHFARVKHLHTVLGAGVFLGGVVAAAQIEPLKELLLKVRGSGEGPPAEKRKKNWFTVDFVGTGGGTTVRTRVSGGDPGYTETAKMLSESAMCLANDDLEPRFGVLTTAQAMGEHLIKRLQDAGIRFETL